MWLAEVSCISVFFFIPYFLSIGSPYLLINLGLDIPSVQLVINHNVPSNPKEYVHRVGRTARAGRGGFSVTLITPNDIKLLHAVEGRIGKELKEFKVKGIHVNF